MLGLVLRTNPTFLGEEVLLALHWLTIYGRIMSTLLQGVAAIGFPAEAERGQAEVTRLATDVENVAGDWGIVADMESQRLPSRTSAALLSACLLLRTHHRSCGVFTQNLSISSPHSSPLPSPCLSDFYVQQNRKLTLWRDA
jgi:hypothetical protein